MWKFFPKHWFTLSDAKERARSAAVDALSTAWLDYLSTAVSRTLKKQFSSTEVINLLSSLNGSSLVSIDGRMRCSWECDSGWPRNGNISLTPIQGATNETCAYLFCASCNSNGFIRQQGLQAFVHYPGRLAMATALIRCDDWVPQVRQAAIVLLQQLIEKGSDDYLFDFLDLVVTLENRKRTIEHPLREHVEQRLLSNEHSDRRWQAATEGTPLSKVFVLRLILRADPDRILEAVQLALSDPHPAVARWALTTIDSLPKSVAAAHLIKLALKHRHAGIRAEAVRRYAQTNADDLHSMLEHSLFDRTPAVRNAGATTLERVFAISAIEKWREEIHNQNGPRTYVAILALSEHAKVIHVPELIAQFGNSKARVRVAILRTLWRLRSPELSTTLSVSLTDSSSIVVRQAVAIYSRGSEVLDAALLQLALKSAQTHGIRQSLLNAAHALGKWEGLLFLLSECTSANDDDLPLVTQELRRWLQFSNQRFTTLSPELAGQINIVFQSAAHRSPGFEWKAIKYALL
jgi:hypothetical protein